MTAAPALHPDSDRKGLLCLVVCAASPARHTVDLVDRLGRLGWQVQVYATRDGVGWLDRQHLADLTGRPVLAPLDDVSDEEVSTTDVTPSVVVVAPATFHTVNAIAAGLNNSLALQVVHAAIGAGVPVAVAPHVNQQLAAHPLYPQSLRRLRKFGITTLAGEAVCDGGCPPGKHWPTLEQILARWQPPRSEATIRVEQPEDTAAAAHAHVASWQAGYAPFVPTYILDRMDPQEQATKRLAALSNQDDAVTLVAVRAGAVVGHVTVRPYPANPDDGQVWACYTHPDMWGTGVADDLLQRGLFLLTQPVVRLWLLESNARALAFYRRHGFQPDGQRGTHTFSGTDVSLPIIRMTLHRG